jgi:hypothetical protein
MKKFASVLLAVLVVFSMFSFVVSAAGASLTASASKTADIKAGDKVTVTVKLSENSGLGTFEMVLKYDASAFKVKSMEAGDGTVVVNPNYATGKAFATGATATTYDKAITVCTVEFEALKAADSTMSVEVVEACDKDYNIVTVSTNTVSFKGFVEAPSETPSETPSEKPTEKPTEKPSETPTEPTDPSEHECDSNNALVIKAPTCKEPGIKQTSCKICGENVVEEPIPATGKCTAGKWEVVKAATTTAEGEKVQKCKDCGEVLQRAKIAKLPSDPITNPAIPNTDAQA